MRISWSKRTAWDLAETPWARELARRRATGAPLFDLTAANPTTCGLVYQPEAVLGPLRNPEALRYEPDPRGHRSAREAVSRYYTDLGASVDPERILLTTSTSEAYSFLFRLLCDPGDEVLIGQPGYPLFDFLARLDDVNLAPYQLFYDHGWHLDVEGLRRRITARTRAMVVVHPNNPTGHFAPRAAIEAVCREHGLALIVDEVFLDYGVAGNRGRSFATDSHPVPTFVLSGLSKVAALPQMKAAWMACFAEEEAYQRLEVISDTFLSMSAPIQWALPGWLAQRTGLQGQIRERVERNLAALDTVLAGQGPISQGLVSRLEFEAGWYAVLRVPGVQSEEEMAFELLVKRSVAIHPGNFFGFPGPGWVVVSLLTPEEKFLAGAEAICEQFKATREDSR